MKFTAAVFLLTLSGLAWCKPVQPSENAAISRNPTRSLAERSTSTCDQWGTIQTGSFIVYNNLWGESSATSGSQCTTVTGLTNGIVSWKTAWSWAGGSSSVKSYSNAALQFTPKTLASISSLKAVWQWRSVSDVDDGACRRYGASELTVLKLFGVESRRRRCIRYVSI